ncbi:EAL domain, c-di-GMP-specific phosphodiesterase class I (or its enzymatically inactive variant) [Enterovibrio nigricans DSM 22720]|uniref:EAL domain, c-di-GMP-specific phosphodiesterase class I (Or its enzymatically inactive variant) n=2 Tax=Enterovibrio nigricans TaxID=504469 RepID=A0A1T4V8D3_9GAMM|nr:EAL domain, c-di-GMP-specific phosphodiesterase class I (or its enzymatically inactive variant) [Enterovibrio nigricans DSM 22720]
MLLPNRTLWMTAAVLLVLLFGLTSVRFSSFFPELSSQTDGLDADYSYFVDNSNSHILSYVLNSAIFRHIDDPSEIPWHVGYKSYWIKMDLQNKVEQHRHQVLYFDTPLIDRLDIYMYSADDVLMNQWKLGDSEQRGYDVGDMPPAVHFQIDPKEKVTIYLKVSSSGVPVMPIWLLDEHNFHKVTQLLHFIWGGFVSILGIVAIYTFAVFVSLKERVYLVYALYVVTAMVQLGALHGFGTYLFPATLQTFFSNNIVTLTYGLFILSLLYAHLYFRVHQSQSLLRQVVHYGLMVLGGLMLLSFVLPEHISGSFLIAVQPLFYGLIGTLVWRRWKLGKNWGRMFVLSWVPLIIAGVFPPLLVTGTIEYTLMSRYAFMIGTVLAVLFMALALAERVRQQRQDSVFQLTHDSVSLLPNLNVLNLVVDRLVEKATPFTLCCFQIDRFESLSPYMSAEEKAHFINAICDRLTHALDSDDVYILERGYKKLHRVACLKEGSFGFIVLSTNTDDVSLFVSSVIDEVEGYVELTSYSIRAQGTVGMSLFPKDGGQPDVLINKAVQAVTETSPNEKRVNTYDCLDNFNRTLNMSLVADLKKAIENDELELFHQPQIDLRTGTIHGSEVLLRWEHPKYGQISPEVFVKLAEEVGLINELTMWVMKRAFFQQSKLIDMGFSRRLSINVSASDIAIPNLVDRICDLANSYRVPTGLLSLELTESTLVSDYDRLHEVIEKLSQFDIEVSIDDYGTGYSSLTYLSQLQFTELKIDRGFIQSLTSSPRQQNIVRATTEMAKSLGLMVVAEGVEDLETVSVLKRYGVDIAQGYHYSRPLSFSQYLIYLKRTCSQMPAPVSRTRRDSQSG